MRKLDLDDLDAVSGGLDVRTLHNHLATAPGGGTDPFNHAYAPGGHVGPQFDPFVNAGHHFPVAGAPLQLHPTPHLPAATSPTTTPAAAAAANPLSAITGLLNSLSHLGGSNNTGGARAGSTPAAASHATPAASHGAPAASHDYAAHTAPSQGGSYYDSPRPASVSANPAPHAASDPFTSGTSPVPYLNNPYTQAQQGAAHPADPFTSGASPVPYLNNPYTQAQQGLENSGNPFDSGGQLGPNGTLTGPNSAFANSGNPFDSGGQLGSNGANNTTPGFEHVAVPDYPTAAPQIDTTGVTQQYSDADIAANNASLGNYQDSASPPQVSDPVPQGPTAVADNSFDSNNVSDGGDSFA